MPSAVIRNLNSYVTVADADAYLDDSMRASAWSGYDDDKKARALITATRIFDKQCWQGTKTGVQNVTVATVAVGGTGYAVNDVLTVSGGTFGEAAQAKVTAAPAGVVTAVQLLNAGTYTANPSSPAATTSAGGTGCTLTLTLDDQERELPHTGMVDAEGDAVPSDSVAPDILAGLIEYAFELAQDADAETTGSTASDIKRLKADTVEVEYFRGTPPGAATRFPLVVWEYVRKFMCGSGGSSRGGIASGTCAKSQFDDCDTYGLTGGLS